MIKNRVSVVIPARNEQFLTKTIKDLLQKAVEDIEIIAVLDGYWPEADEIVLDKRVHYINYGESKGMRNAINQGVALSTGEYILKSDAHCMFDEGFDKKLKADCKDDWVVVPRRLRLEPESWTLRDVNKPPMDYMLLTYPMDHDTGSFGGPSLQGREWRELNRDPELKKKEIDDLMSFQGSAWFMKRDYFYWLELMDIDTYGDFAKEAQEIGLKAWLSGGRVVRNKKTWYAHLHKGKKYGRGYHLSKSEFERATPEVNKWMNSKVWHKQRRNIKWLINHFSPVPTWPNEFWNRQDESLPKFKSRDELPAYFNSLGFKVGAEIGVAGGHFSEKLCKGILGLKLFCIDPWGTYKENRRGGGQSQHDRNYELAQQKLSGYNADMIRKFSMDAVKDFPDEFFDFVYLDGNHDYKYILEDIVEWSKKVKKGGIVSGHDYYHFNNSGVIEAVDKYVRENNLDLQLTEGSRENPDRDDRCPSFWWIKK